jgi:predicted RecA/RadA family phage recombinase
MATNMIYKDGDQLKFYTNASLNSGDPFVVGQIPAVALANEDSDKYTVGRLAGVFDLSVKGIDGSGNSAVSIGDKIYYVTGDTPKLNKKATGVFFGYALEAIASGETDTIKVLLK